MCKKKGGKMENFKENRNSEKYIKWNFIIEIKKIRLDIAKRGLELEGVLVENKKMK